uniref:Uncharacterized protein n=1 Tax=Oryza punctata TaxID=4537 RepID=A0A0E0JY49_ORYPU
MARWVPHPRRVAAYRPLTCPAREGHSASASSSIAAAAAAAFTCSLSSTSRGADLHLASRTGEGRGSCLN